MNNKNRAKFITIEGQDGAGKSTNLDFIKQYLLLNEIDVWVTREPGGTQLGEKLRDLLLYGTSTKCTDMTELLLMFAARSQHIHEVIFPNLHAGNWVVSDRFTDASYAYQGAGRGMDPEQIQVLENLVLKGFTPDLTLLLDVPLDTAKSRGATDSGDRFERQRDEFKLRVRDYYQSLAQQQPARVKLIDANQPLSAVQNDIATHLDALINSIQVD